MAYGDSGDGGSGALSDKQVSFKGFSSRKQLQGLLKSRPLGHSQEEE